MSTHDMQELVREITREQLEHNGLSASHPLLYVSVSDAKGLLDEIKWLQSVAARLEKQVFDMGGLNDAWALECDQEHAKRVAAEVERDNARACARHYYEECMTQGELESDTDWLRRNPWLVEDDGLEGGDGSEAKRAAVPDAQRPVPTITHVAPSEEGD